MKQNTVKRWLTYLAGFAIALFCMTGLSGCGELATYSIEYNLDGGENNASNPTTYLQNSESFSLKAPTKEGYTFEKWHLDAIDGEEISEITKGTNKDLVVYAEWTANTYTLTFNANGGTVDPESQSVTFGDAIGDLSTPTREGYTFTGWKINEDTENISIDSTTTYIWPENKTAVAQWTANTYTLTFNANGGTVDPESQSVTFGDAIGDLSTPTREGYTFTGWTIDDTTTIAADTTYSWAVNQTAVAQWTANTYTLTFNANGGTGEMENQTLTYDKAEEKLSANTFEKEGFDFAGWKCEENGQYYTNEQEVPNITRENGATVTLKAVWGTEKLLYSEVYTEDEEDPFSEEIFMGYKVKKGSDCTATNIVIPETYKGKPVVAIAYNGFASYTTLTSISLPNTLKEIDDKAFYGCTGFTEIVLPEGVERIGSNAFSGCTELTTISIPNSIISIDSNAFNNCNKLTYNSSETEGINGSYLGNEKNKFVVLAHFGGTETTCHVDDSTKIILSNVFAENEDVKNILFGENSQLEYISESAFSGSNLETIELPEGVKEIGGYAFKNCKALKTIAIPKDVTAIECETFFGCTKLQTVTFAEDSKLECIEEDAFYGCHNLEHLWLPESVRIIEEGVFDGTNLKFTQYKKAIYLGSKGNPCFALIKVMAPNIQKCILNENTKVIADGAFAKCENLKNVELNDGLIAIGSGAFADCIELEELTALPESLEIIGEYAFGCCALKNIVIPDKVECLEGGTFYGCGDLKSVTIGKNVKYIGDEAFSGCTFLRNCNFASDSELKLIGNGAFYNCKLLTSIVLPNSVKYIGDEAFSGCFSLETITIPDSIKYIGYEAFYDCSALESVVFPAEVTDLYLDEGIFADCVALKSVILPEGLEYISDGMFAGCTNLASVYIPTSVKYCGGFQGCTKLEKVYYSGTLEELNEIEWMYMDDVIAECYIYSEQEPTEAGYYWHYVDGVITDWSEWLPVED